jgi:hypothetical protein
VLVPHFIQFSIQVIEGVSPTVAEVAGTRIQRVVGADDGKGDAVDGDDEVLLAETELADFEFGSIRKNLAVEIAN